MTQPQPALFVPHGAPTFALRPGAAGAAIADLARTLPPARAIVIVSAHWDTAVPTVGCADRLETLHDFHGFPAALYELRYPATGCRAAAEQIVAALRAAGLPVERETARGLDHGAWVPLRLIFLWAAGAGLLHARPAALAGEALTLNQRQETPHAYPPQISRTRPC